MADRSNTPWADALAFMEERERERAANPRYQLPEAKARPQQNEWASALATGVDLLLNSGRGTPELLAYAEAKRKAADDEWRETSSPEARLAQQMAIDKAADAHETARMTQASQLAGVIGDQADREEKIRQFSVQDSRERSFHADNLAQKGLDRDLDAKQFDRQLASTESNQRATRGLEGARLRQSADQFTKNFDRGIVEFDAKQTLEREKMQAGIDEAKLRAAATGHAAASAPLGYQTVGEEGLARWTSQAPADRTHITDQLAKHAAGRETVIKLRGLLADAASNGKDPAKEAEYNRLIQQSVGDRSQENSTGVLSNTEWARTIRNMPEYGGSIGQAWSVGGFRGLNEALNGRSPSLDALDLAVKDADDRMNAVAKIYGLEAASKQPASRPGVPPGFTLME